MADMIHRPTRVVPDTARSFLVTRAMHRQHLLAQCGGLTHDARAQPVPRVNAAGLGGEPVNFLA